MIFTEEHKIINALVPSDGQSDALATDIISLKNYRHCTFVWQIGIANTSSASSVNLILNKGEDVTTCATAMIGRYRVEDTASGDTLEALTELPVLGISIGSGNTEDYNTGLTLIVVEVDAADLEPTAANPYDTVGMTVTMSAHEVFISCVAILSKPRYASDTLPTAITN